MNIISKLIYNNHSFSFKSTGESMLPSLLPEDIVYIRKSNNITIDDIVLIKNGSTLFIHRIIDIKKGKYIITKGDNNIKPDKKIKFNKILGKVYAIKRGKEKISINKLYESHSLLYIDQITKLLNKCNNENIEYVLMNGLPLQSFYGKRYPLRIYADCSLLINIADYSKIINVFDQKDYIQVRTDYSKIHELFEEKLLRICFIKKVQDITVTFYILFKPTLIMNQVGKLPLYPHKYLEAMTSMFLKEKIIMSFHGINIPYLSNSNLLLYLCIDFSQHNFRELYRLRLIREIIEKLSKKMLAIVLNELAEKIKKLNVQNFVYPSFIILNDYFNCKISNRFLTEIAPNQSKIKYINSLISKANPIISEYRVNAGLEHFKLLFILSPMSPYQKIFSLISIKTIYSLIWLIWYKLRINIQNINKKYLNI